REGPQPVAETRTAQRSHIAEGMSVKGDIDGDIDLLLDGKLEGNLRCRSVTVGKTGELLGQIKSQEAIINGSISGSIEAKIVKLNVTATMIGDVRHEVIEVAAGAKIEGNYSHITEKALPKPSVKSSHKTDSGEMPPKTPASAINPIPVSRSDSPISEPIAAGSEAKPH
ncbi:MAG: polymer-forming cytoskeletal protein, partial [Alphaproteobacteria bacterium]|nr:polymer-forming cytoskeletal protein [Alphaproteobacteria bacterium]